ncbi:N-6 DNA methylase [Streptomyces sp. HUAS MG91]|uniref:site-specific DNA-methyltransferase (adenine-specific) n=1 Tax=Streptomyces tabacisoli TaxID=3156398 RepID=A0AAU8IMG3_9ACTN
MPPRKKKQTSAVDLLWKAVDLLRGSMDAAQYKITLLTLLYLRHLPAESTDGEDATAPPTVTWWRTFRERISAHPDEAVAVLDELVQELTSARPDLKNIVAPAWSVMGGLAPQQVKDLVLLLDRAPDEAGTTPAELATLYTSFTTWFAEAEGKKGGEYYTPTTVARLLVELLGPISGRLYDPCCGIGGTLVEATRSVTANGGDPHTNLTIHGQEVNETTWRLARMHLAMNGLGTAGVHLADTFAQDCSPALKADVVLAHPPFNLSDWARDEADPRWRYGAPPRANANFAWLQHAVHKLNDSGSAAVVLANGSMSSKAHGEAAIRAAMVEDDLVACIVALPGQLFRSTQIPACVWIVAKSKSSGGGRGMTDRRGQTLFIDARSLGVMVDRGHRALTDDDVSRIAGAYRAWRGTGAAPHRYSDVPGFCRSVDLDGIREGEYSLAPGRYVGVEEPVAESAEPVQNSIDVLTRELLDLMAQVEQGEAELRRHWFD